MSLIETIREESATHTKDSPSEEMVNDFASVRPLLSEWELSHLVKPGVLADTAALSTGVGCNDVFLFFFPFGSISDPVV